MISEIITIILSLLLGFTLLGIAVAVCGTVFIISLVYSMNIMRNIFDWIKEKLKNKKKDEDDAL